MREGIEVNEGSELGLEEGRGNSQERDSERY
jgi:hypothetical protein